MALFQQRCHLLLHLVHIICSVYLNFNLLSLRCIGQANLSRSQWRVDVIIEQQTGWSQYTYDMEKLAADVDGLANRVGLRGPEKALRDEGADHNIGRREAGRTAEPGAFRKL